MATSTAQQSAARLAFDQSRRMPRPTESSSPSERVASAAPADRGTAMRLAQSLASGQRNKDASLDKQVAGEVGARLGQVVGAYAGGVGAPIGKRIGRVMGEHWRIVLFMVFVQAIMPALLLMIGLFVAISVLAWALSFTPEWALNYVL